MPKRVRSPRYKSLYVSRFRLFHHGYLDVVRYILTESEYLIIAIGAAQLFGYWDNPFSGEERAEMIASALREEKLIERAYIVQIDESNVWYNEWTSLVEKICPPFDLVYSNSELVRQLFEKAGYQAREVPRFKRKEFSFEYLRERITRDELWDDFVPHSVARFIKEHDLDERLKRLNPGLKRKWGAIG